MKKRSNSFKDAVSKVLDEGTKKKKKKTNDELIGELYGSGSGSNYVPAGITVASKQGTGFSRGMMPPYSSMSDAGGGDGGIDMRDLQPDNDVSQPNVMAYPLQTADEHLAASAIKLADVLELVAAAKENSALSEKKIELLKNLDNKIKTIIGHIGKVKDEIMNINLA